MLSINNFLTDFLYGYGYKPKDRDVINTGGDSERDKKINNLIKKITGDGNNNETKKIVSIKIIPKLNNVEKKNKNTSLTNDMINIHQFYSPTNDVL
jgi:hypothetical protein